MPHTSANLNTSQPNYFRLPQIFPSPFLFSFFIQTWQMDSSLIKKGSISVQVIIRMVYLSQKTTKSATKSFGFRFHWKTRWIPHQTQMPMNSAGRFFILIVWYLSQFFDILQSTLVFLVLQLDLYLPKICLNIEKVQKIKSVGCRYANYFHLLANCKPRFATRVISYY